MMGAAALSACQPADSVSNDASNSEHAANASEDEHPLTSERVDNIEALAGVPMQQLVSFDPQEIKQGGDSGISITSAESYSKPSSNLTASRVRVRFLSVMHSLSSLGSSLLPVPTVEMGLVRYSMWRLVNLAISKTAVVMRP
ncbi:hypothetical protein PKHYL_34360 [Psychrobacter sp. KH172YL61]|nr:hypothetical protein PKHYL_34360 [Psychrobacter sp. KH172YL61]